MRWLSIPAFGVALFFLLLNGCGIFFGKNTTETALIELEVSADDYINPDDNGRSNPVAVRLYQLKVNGTDLRLQGLSQVG